MDELGTLAEERSRIYWLLSRFFLTPPDACFLAELDREPQSMPDEEPDAIDTALAELRQSLRSASIPDLHAEYLRLFGGLREGYGPPPPFESLHREGRLMGRHTEAVMRHYRANGFSLAHESVGPEDHLGLELKFLALLCHAESRRWRDGNATAGRAALAAQQAFIDAHLHAWAPAYCQRVRDDAQHPFFRATASLAAASIEQDARQLSALLNELSATGMEENLGGRLQ